MKNINKYIIESIDSKYLKKFLKSASNFFINNVDNDDEYNHQIWSLYFLGCGGHIFDLRNDMLGNSNIPKIFIGQDKNDFNKLLTFFKDCNDNSFVTVDNSKYNWPDFTSKQLDDINLVKIERSKNIDYLTTDLTSKHQWLLCIGSYNSSKTFEDSFVVNHGLLFTKEFTEEHDSEFRKILNYIKKNKN